VAVIGVDRRRDPAWREPFLTDSMIAGAVTAGDETVATVLLTRLDGGHLFGQESRALMETACTQMAIGVQNALYHRALQEARREAERASQFKSDFLANMSHEIRTPMNAILGFAELLFEDEPDPRRRRWLGLIRDAGDNLLAIINDILDISRIEAGKLEISAGPCSLRGLLEGVWALFLLAASEKGLALTLSIDDATPGVVRGDEHRIRQVLINLVGNAVKFTERGSVGIHCGWLDGAALLRVEDTGIGMTEEQRSRVFQAFEQADRSTTRRFGGTGLGMAISYTLCHLMGGSIEVESGRGEGTTFTVRLPLPAAALTPGEASLRPAARDGARCRVGFVEGDPIQAARLRETLERDGLDALHLERTDDFVSEVAAARLDVLLLGGAQGARGGLELNDLLKQEPLTAHLPVIVISGGDASRPGDDLSGRLAAAAEEAAASNAAGEAMVQRWLDDQGLPELRELLLESLRERLRDEVATLAAAIQAGDVDAVHRHAHTLKGWSGSFKLREVYEITRRVDQDALSDAPDHDQMKRSAFALGEIIARIPSRYLGQRDATRAAARPPAPADFTVLVADDNHMNRELVLALLKRRGVSCDLVEDGQQALDALREKPYDLLLLDMQMPVMDGWSVVGIIRQTPALADLYVIALTAHALVGAGERCVAAGCDEYLAKPLDHQLFYDRIEARLRQRAPSE